MRNIQVDPTAIIDDEVKIGEGTKIWHFSHIIRGSRIGKNCTIGQNVMIGPNVTIGDGCKIQNNVSIFEGVLLENNVFCGPGAMFTNDRYPRAHVPIEQKLLPTVVREGASIGANATIVCGLTINRYALIGAGAVVTKDVPAFALMAGNPAVQIGWVCSCGQRLAEDFSCPDQHTNAIHEHPTH